MDQQTDNIRIPSESFQTLTSRLYQSVDVPEADADTVARMQVETDERGVYSHGTRALPGYVRGIIKGGINPKPAPRVLTEAPATALIDADNSLGHGAAACFAMMALPAKMIGFSTTKTGGASVVPHGGSSGLLGNHPIAYAIPTQAEPPIVLDMACGWIAWGHVGTYAIEEKQLPFGWALDADGKPTRDPSLARGMLTVGGYKGHGLAIVMSILGGVLTGGPAACNRGAETPPELARRGHFFYAVKVDNFSSIDEFTARVDEEIRTIRNAKRADGVDRIYLPGEIEWLHQQEAQRDGIPLHQKHLKALEDLADELSVEVFWR